MKLLDESIERVVAAVKANPDQTEYTLSRDRLHDYAKVRGHDVGGNACVARLRLDWEEIQEVRDSQLINNTNVHALRGLQTIGREDLKDLIIYGDINSSDVLLTSIKGENVRGKKAVEVDIFQISFYPQYVPKKCMVEWTIYILMYVEFED